MITKKNIILNNEYSAESIVDIEQDVYDSLDGLPQDEHGFVKGWLEVRVTHCWEEEALPNHSFDF